MTSLKKAKTNYLDRNPIKNALTDPTAPIRPSVINVWRHGHDWYIQKQATEILPDWNWRFCVSVIVIELYIEDAVKFEGNIRQVWLRTFNRLERFTNSVALLEDCVFTKLVEWRCDFWKPGFLLFFSSLIFLLLFSDNSFGIFKQLDRIFF